MSKRARTILTLLVILFLAFYARHYGQYGDYPANPPGHQEEGICPGTALTNRDTAEHLGQGGRKALVYGHGEVVKILPDDDRGIRHQRFLLKVAPGLVVLVAHNTDIAKKIGGLSAGDRLSFCGEYIWNDKGGVLHWTHHDPAGRHPDGWLSLNHTLYR
ncbi:MAG: DUF3465 domain-containing protein [Desulfobulbaceae bacterium]|jgi:hypothetical protein|nr:DUF3465 domain-containing protein [Desulfobulbaceae bacterium]